MNLIQSLKQGNSVEFEGVTLRMAGNGQISPGDTYLAQRNTVQLLTCRRTIQSEGWIVPKEVAYPFDIHECVAVEIQ